ncbi:glycoside hydrolase [Syncephalis fuscata]|nr:glycoside hydrolase [Syncephalis fuscata]
MQRSWFLILFLLVLLPTPSWQDNSAVLSKRASGSGMVVGYYTDWNSQQLPPNKIDYSKLTHINYAFALINANTNAPTIQTANVLTDLVKNAHQHNVRVAISIGGWSGSAPFSAIAADSSKRSRFIQQTRDFVAKYNLDGVDIDWEYPGRATNGVTGRKDDSSNFLTLLKELRSQLPKDKYISAAVRVEPFDGPNGPMKDVSAFAGPLSFVQVMAYDVYGSWSSTTGPNAPFDPAKSGNEPPVSFTTAAKAWSDAKFPREKIVMGLAFYGRSAVAASALKANSMYGQQNKNVAQAAGADGSAGSGGVWTWKDLRSNKILTSTSAANKGTGWQRNWDDGTKTPWLYNDKSKTFISYDDPQSLAVKVNYVRKNNYGGVMIWALNQDNGELLSTVASGNSGRLKAMEASANSNSLESRTNFIRLIIFISLSILVIFI